MPNAIRVLASALYIHPVKACAPFAVDRLDFDEDGRVAGDREWAVVDDAFDVVWQGSHPRLALVVPDFSDGVLSLRSAAGDVVEAARAPDRSPCQVRLWNDRTRQNEVYGATDEGSAAAEFLWRTVGAKLRLVRFGSHALHRAGLSPVHIVSRTSCEELDVELAHSGHRLASLERFRPNLVVCGEHEPLLPFLEEHFSTLDWTHETRRSSLSIRSLCVRCVVPNVDPASGAVDANVLDTVGKLSARRHPGKPICFGVYAKPAARASLLRGTVLSAHLAF